MAKEMTYEELEVFERAKGADYQEALCEPIKWFKHDTNARNDPKLRRLAREMGREWRDVWWCLVELLHDTDGHECSVDDFEWLAHELWITESECFAFAEKLVEIGLADAQLYSDGWLSLPRVQRNAHEYAEGHSTKVGNAAVTNFKRRKKHD